MKSLLLAILFGLLMVGCGEDPKKEATTWVFVQEEAEQEEAVQEDAEQEEAVQEDAVQEDETKNESTITLGENFTVHDLNLDMIWVKPGTFTMGSPVSEAKQNILNRQHQVTLTKGFYLGKYEVTQAQWKQVMGDNPSHFKGADRPVEKVTWNRAVDFCNKLTEMEKKVGRVPQGMFYQLPTESQWEYACRSGTTTKYSWGDDIDPKLTNYKDSGLKKTGVVGSYRPNAWGFYDMHGNVGEWTADWFGIYPSGSVTNPFGPQTGSTRALRGGSWGHDGTILRSAKRHSGDPNVRFFRIGFRVSFQKS
jgi:sulfatase modifying factor 1